MKFQNLIAKVYSIKLLYFYISLQSFQFPCHLKDLPYLNVPSYQKSKNSLHYFSKNIVNHYISKSLLEYQVKALKVSLKLREFENLTGKFYGNSIPKPIPKSLKI